MDNPTWWTPTLILAGGLLLLWQKRREFHRTNQYGIQQYASFGQKLRAQGFDSLLIGIGFLSMAAGAGLLIFGSNSVESWLALGIVILILSSRRKVAK